MRIKSKVVPWSNIFRYVEWDIMGLSLGMPAVKYHPAGFFFRRQFSFQLRRFQGIKNFLKQGARTESHRLQIMAGQQPGWGVVPGVL